MRSTPRYLHLSSSAVLPVATFPVTIVLVAIVLVVTGCAPDYPNPECYPGTACYSDDLSEIGGQTGTGLGSPVPEAQFTVVGSNISAVIETQPFKLIFKDQDDKVVLESLNSSLPNYHPECYFIEPNIEGEFLSSEVVYGHQCERYHALHFESGPPQEFQIINLLTVEPLKMFRQATHYFSTHVTSATVLVSGIELEVATTRDNTTITVLIESDPSGTDAMRVEAKVNDGSAQAVAFAFASNFSEAFYGFGGRRNTLDQRGNALYSWTLDGMGQYSDNAAYNFHRIYAPQSLFISSRDYGLMVENTEFTRFYMGSDRADAWKVTTSSDEVAFVVAASDSKKSIETLTAISGRHKTLPEWAKGFIFAHRTLVDLFGTTVPGPYFDDTMDHLNQLDARGITTSAYLIEPWASSKNITPTQLATLISEIQSRGMKPMLYIREQLSKDFLSTEDDDVFDEAFAQGYMPTQVNGVTPYTFTHYTSPTSVVDYSNPAALVWWEQRVRELLDVGGEGFMLDFGEQVQFDMHFFNGETGRSMHNKLPILAAKETAAIVDAYELENPGREIMYFTRSSFNGRPGSAAYEYAAFLGDNTQNWNPLTGIPSVIPDVLNRGLGGTYNLTTDVAGYFDQFGETDKELFIRWTQLATFVAVFRLHNSPLTPMATPWSFDQEAEDLFKDAIALRTQALPYMNTLWAEAELTGLPLWRAMWLEFPDDARFRNSMHQFMLGSDVLVAPVVAQGAVTKSVVLPQGCWTYVSTNTDYTGNQTVSIAAPLDTLPYFFKCGETPF